MLKGFDMYSGNALPFAVNWSYMANSFDFGVFKFGGAENKLWKSIYVDDYAKKARAVGLKVGFYFF